MAWTGDRRARPRHGARRLPERLRQRVLARDPWCRLQIPGVCTGRSEQVDHVVDDADHGPDSEDNLQGACTACHRHKSARNSGRRGGGPGGSRVLRQPERRPNR
ncbi:HNH endonuclease [Mycolicibacterium murale]|uniref:HNH endonuclease n=1 Tax=Mycolicibacterium murale TaxID=182220 RepID=UPI001875B075|nr:HNH endonuclease [Mycolicibacterium murale]